MDEKNGAIYSEKIDHTLIPPIKRIEINIIAALLQEDKKPVEIDCQADFEKLEKSLKGKTTHDEVKEVIKSENFDWIHCEKL